MQPTDNELKKAILDSIAENGYNIQVTRLFNLLLARYPDITQQEFKRNMLELANEMKKEN